MILAAMYFSVALFSIPCHGNDDFCKLVFEDEGLDDAFDCKTSSLTNLTKKSDKGTLEIIDGTDSYSEFHDGQVFELDCCFYSHPYCPIITWYKDGVEIKDNRAMRKIKKGRTLQINATHDAGGNYTCTATTPYGEVASHTIRNVQVIRTCAGKLTVVKIPDTNVIKAKKGSCQVLRWNFLCAENRRLNGAVICRNGSHNLISSLDSYYKITQIHSKKNDKISLLQTITISNFSRSENITCTTEIQGSPSATFVLLEEGQPSVADQRQKNEKDFFSEKGIWIVTGGSVLLCLVVVLLIIRFIKNSKKSRNPLII